jgi:hypothetical protein
MIEWTQETEKRVGRMLQIILTDPALLAIHQRFGGEVFRRSSVFHDLKRFLEQCDVRGDTCLEIGTWNGITAVILSRMFRRVVTMDIFHNPVRHEILSHLGISNVEFIDLEDNEHKARLVRDLDFDFAYLDGNHAEDTELDWSLANRCGRVLFQECLPMQPPVHNLVRKLPPEEVVYGGVGLALWRRSS